MSEYDPNEVLPKGTIVYPEIEALRYVIAEQKKEIRRLADWNNELRDLLELALLKIDSQSIDSSVDIKLSDLSKDKK